MPIPNIVSFGTLSKDVATGHIGTVITISNTGTGFFGTMLVDVGGTACTDITLVDHQHLTCKSPGVTGTVNVTNPDGETGTAGTWTDVPYSATGTPSISITSTGVGGFTAPVYSATGAPSISITSVGVGGFTIPVYSATGTPSISITSTGVGGFTAPVYSATGAPSISITSVGVGGFTVPVYLATGTPSISITSVGVGGFTVPVYSATGTPSISITSVGIASGPAVYLGVGSSSLGLTTISDGLYDVPVYSATGTPSISITSAGVGGFTIPVYLATGVGSLGLTSTSSGVYSPPVYFGVSMATIVLSSVGVADYDAPYLGVGTPTVDFTSVGATSIMLVTSASYDSASKTGIVNGLGFEAHQGAFGKVELSLDGIVWIEPDSYDSWNNTTINFTFIASIPDGLYMVKVTNNSFVEALLLDVFSVGANSSKRYYKLSLI